MRSLGWNQVKIEQTWTGPTVHSFIRETLHFRGRRWRITRYFSYKTVMKKYYKV